jgi:predicted Zn-dependent peptidase
MSFETYKLKNNAQIVLVPLQNTKSLTTLVMYPVGSRYETEKLSGVSHYVEHLMFKGTKKRKNTLTLTREIDRLGAEYNAFTGKEYTGYYIKTDAAYAETSFDILSDMLFNSKFDAKEMEREKHVIVEELRMYNDNPIMNIDNIFEELMFAGCALGRDIGGTEKHVLSYKRKDVLAYRNRYYNASNMTVVIAGAIDENTTTLLDKYFGAQKKNTTSKKNFKPGIFGPAKKQERVTVQHKKTDQAQMMIGFPGFEYGNKNSQAISVLNTILGGSMSSRLFIKIRERLGLAYTVRSGSDCYRDIGYVYVRAGLEAKNINKAIAAIKKEIQRVIDNGVTARELADAKTHIRGGLTLSLENSSVQADWYAKQSMFYKEIKTPEQKLREIERVTREDVQNIAKKVFKFNQMRVGVIGDVDAKDIVL